MLSLSAKIRKTLGKKVKNIRKEGIIPAVLYGSKTENLLLEVDLKEFEKIYKTAGESSLISLQVPEKKKKFSVLIHNVQFEALTDKPIHIDFFQPSLEEEIEVGVPLVFEGESRAVKDFGGTLIKNISEIEVRAFPQDLPPEIKVDIGILETFEDEILIKDIKIPNGVKLLREMDEIVAVVSPPEKVEEELEKPIEEKVEEVEKVEKKEEKAEEEIEEKKETKESKSK